MKIMLADNVGFCFGVKRAVKLAEQALKEENKEKVYSLGSLIHNKQEVERLERKGLSVANSLKGLKKGRILVRSHGIRPEMLNEIKKRKLDIIDATCPFVKSCQKVAGMLHKEGYGIVIIGDKSHPEVKSILGCTEDKAFVVNNITDERKVIKWIKDMHGKIGVVSQTTRSKEIYVGVVSKLLRKNFHEVRIFDTICSDATKRQNSVSRMAMAVDVMVVIGGKMSANTKRLAQICRDKGTKTYHIETAKGVKKGWFSKARKVGVASGASTPDWIIQDVVDKLRQIK